MKIEIELLRAAVNRLLDDAKTLRGDAVEIDTDLYWFVPKEVLNDLTKDPSGLTLGSLGDEWVEVAAIGEGAKDPVSYALVWASGVLRAVGEKLI